MKAVELFAGVGGFRLGLERSGHEVVWANEWDKYACDTYDKNFAEKGHLIDRRDITTIPAGDIPPHDLICGGFPCQAFSIAGKRRGFEETRGTLFFDILRLARHHRTPYLLLENVKGLLNHDGGRTFDTIIRALDESGYDCQWQVLNSKDFGVPQNRERVYIVGHLRGQPRPEVFPLGQDDGLHPPTRSREGSEAQISNALRAHGTGGRGDIEDSFIRVKINQLNNPVRASDRVYGENGIGPTLNTMQGGRRQPMVAIDGKPSSTRRGFMKDGYTGAIETDQRQLIAKTVRSGGGNSPHGAKQNWDSYEIEGRIRRLTPTECERLQGFPDNWTAGVSDTQRYKQMGNAVTVNVVQAVASKLSWGSDDV